MVRGQGSGRGGRPQRATIQVPENVSEFYANAIQILVTPWDITMLFGSTSLPENISAPGGPNVRTIRMDAVIRMSPQHAKSALSALQRMIDSYEERFGTINIPQEEVQEGSADANT